MKLNNIKIDRLFLESGQDLRLNDKVTVKHPKVSDILSAGRHGEDEYWYCLSLVLSDPYKNMVWLNDEFGLNYQKVDSFDVFCLKWVKLFEQYAENRESFDALNYNPVSELVTALCFFLGEHSFALKKDENDEYYFKDPDEEGYEIHRKDFNLMVTFLQLINGIDYKNRINPATEGARRMLIEDMRDEMKRAERKRKKGIQDDSNDDSIGNMAAVVIHGGNGSITSFNFMNAPIFFFLSAYKIIIKRFNSDHVMNGYYAGTVKRDSINKTTMDWAAP